MNRRFMFGCILFVSICSFACTVQIESGFSPSPSPTISATSTPSRILHTSTPIVNSLIDTALDLIEQTNLEDAIEVLDQAAEIDNQHSEVYNLRGITHGHLGKYDLAIQDLNKAIDMNPDNSSAYYNRM